MIALWNVVGIRRTIWYVESGSIILVKGSCYLGDCASLSISVPFYSSHVVELHRPIVRSNRCQAILHSFNVCSYFEVAGLRIVPSTLLCRIKYIIALVYRATLEFGFRPSALRALPWQCSRSLLRTIGRNAILAIIIIVNQQKIAAARLCKHEICMEVLNLKIVDSYAIWVWLVSSCQDGRQIAVELTNLLPDS